MLLLLSNWIGCFLDLCNDTIHLVDAFVSDDIACGHLFSIRVRILLSFKILCGHGLKSPMEDSLQSETEFEVQFREVEWLCENFTEQIAFTFFLHLTSSIREQRVRGRYADPVNSFLVRSINLIVVAKVRILFFVTEIGFFYDSVFVDDKNSNAILGGILDKLIPHRLRFDKLSCQLESAALVKHLFEASVV